MTRTEPGSVSVAAALFFAALTGSVDTALSVFAHTFTVRLTHDASWCISSILSASTLSRLATYDLFNE